MTPDTRLELLAELRQLQSEYPFLKVQINFLAEGMHGAQERVKVIEAALMSDPAPPIPPPVEGAAGAPAGAGTPVPDPIPEAV